ncbi:MAG: glycosyltransferase family 39 protein [Lachnospiraceae bacterium]|nr:glycosyltransferase family 39 protein [Lachnospiraceae bacterium]
MMKIEKWKMKDVVGFLLLCCSLYIIGRMVGFCFSEDIWYDEVFSAGMMRYSYKEIMNFTAQDVHPPLYYWYLKTFVDIGKAFWGKIDSVIFAKLASVIPMIGLWILAVTKLHKQCGMLTAGIFIFCVYTMPQLTLYSVEIRMYSFALFLVTMAYFYGYEIYKTRQKKAFVGLFICGILVAYTQYFSCIAIALLYLIVGAGIWKDTQARKQWLANVAASVICYLPWMPTVIKQFTTVNSSYWIQPLTWRSLAGCVKYIYLPSGGNPTLNYVFAALMILATLFLGIFFWWKRGSLKAVCSEEGFYICLGLGMLGGLILIGVGVSILVSPVFVYRYMTPCLGAFWFVYALLLADCKKKGLWIPVLLLTLYVGFINVKGVFWEETHKATQMKETKKCLDIIQEDDVLIYNFNHVQATLGYYKNNESYLLYYEPEELIQKIYRDYGMIDDVKQIQELLRQGKNVYFLGSFVSREDIVAEWQDQGLKVEEEGSYLLERYWFNLYSVKE